MATNDPFDGFTVAVFQDEEGDYLAHFVEMPNISAFADTPQLALDELAVAWGGVKASYARTGEPLPAAPDRRNPVEQVNVRMDRHLRKALAREAALSGVSLDCLIAQKLTQPAPPAR